MGALPSREVLMGFRVRKGKHHERRQVSSHRVPAFRDSAGVAGSPCGEECSRNVPVWLSPVESGLKTPRAALVLCILSQAT